jgi:hypothetical protein
MHTGLRDELFVAGRPLRDHATFTGKGQGLELGVSAEWPQNRAGAIARRLMLDV